MSEGRESRRENAGLCFVCKENVAERQETKGHPPAHTLNFECSSIFLTSAINTTFMLQSNRLLSRQARSFRQRLMIPQRQQSVASNESGSAASNSAPKQEKNDKSSMFVPTWMLESASVPTHVPKFIRDTLEGLDPQQGDVTLLEFRVDGDRRFREQRMSKRKLAEVVGVQPRDLRKVLSVSQRRLISGIASRRDCVILHLEHIKAIVMKDRIFLFDHERDARVKAFSRFLPSLVHDIGLTSSGKISFEFRAIEAVLIEVTGERSG